MSVAAGIGGAARNAGQSLIQWSGQVRQKELLTQRNKLLMDLEQMRNHYATERATIKRDHEIVLQKNSFDHDNAAGTPVPAGKYIGIQNREGGIVGYQTDPETGERITRPVGLSPRDKELIGVLKAREKNLSGIVSSDMTPEELRTQAQKELTSTQQELNSVLRPMQAGAGGGANLEDLYDPDDPNAKKPEMADREGAGMGIIGDALTKPWDYAEQAMGKVIETVSPYVPFAGHLTNPNPQTPDAVMAQGKEIVDRVMKRSPMQASQAPGAIIGGQDMTARTPATSAPTRTPAQQGLDQTIQQLESTIAPPAAPDAGGGIVGQPAPAPATAPADPGGTPMASQARQPVTNMPASGMPAQPMDAAIPQSGPSQIYDPTVGQISVGAPIPVSEESPVPSDGIIGQSPTPPLASQRDPYARPRDVTTERLEFSQPAQPPGGAPSQARNLGIIGDDLTPTGPEGPPVNVALRRAFGIAEQPEQIEQPDQPGQPESPTGEDAWAEIAIESIAEHEQFRGSPYPDRGGQATGYGRNLNTGEQTYQDGTPIPENPTEPEARRAMVERITIAADRVTRIIGRDTWDRLDPVRKAVLVEMDYQHGGRGLQGFDKTLAAIAAGNWALAATEMMDSETGRETSPERMATLAERMRTGKV